MLATQHDELGAELGDGFSEHHWGAPEPDRHLVRQLARDDVFQCSRDVHVLLVDEGALQLVHPFFHAYGGPPVTRRVDQMAARACHAHHPTREPCRPRRLGRGVHTHYDGLP